MRIGVVSDTHLPRFGRSLPEALVAELRDVRVERLIHCGDWTDPFVVERMDKTGGMILIEGNSAAALGVSARTSATKSLSVKSIS